MSKNIEAGKNPENLQKEDRFNSPISRRGLFRKTLGVGLTLAMISEACSAPAGAQSQTPRPSESSSPFPSPTLVASTESSPTPEATPKLAEITSDTFIKTFSRLNGDSEISISQKSGTITKTVDALSSITSSNWNEQTTSATISRNPIKALEFVLSSAELSGQTGTIDMSKIFPELDLKLSRFALNNLPNDKDTEKTVNLKPQNLTLRKEMNMTVLGIDTDNKNAVVAFSDSVRKADGSATMYFGILPLETMSKTEEETSFQEILGKNGASYDTKSKSILYENGEILPLRQINSKFTQTITIETGSYFIDLDPLKKNKDGKPVLEINPIIPTPDVKLVPEGSKIKQVDDGRILALDDVGNPIARVCKFKEWKWVNQKEFINDYTMREIADANDLDLGTSFYPPLAENTEYVTNLEAVSNKIYTYAVLNTIIVFRDFTPGDWKKVISNWDSISKSLDKGIVPQNWPFNWNDMDKAVKFAEKYGLKISGENLLSQYVPDNIYNGNFNHEELSKLLEFMTRTRVLKYKGVADQWSVSEACADILFGDNRTAFWYNQLGEKIIDRVFEWAHHDDPSAKLSFTEDGILKFDYAPLRPKYFGFLEHFKKNNVPVDTTTIENNMWIYLPPDKQEMINILNKIKGMGYRIGPPETTVLTWDNWPTWNRPKQAIVTDKLAAQAKIYQDITDAYLEVGAPLGTGDFSDNTSFWDETAENSNAMIMDKNYNPKPAYFAMLNSLKSKFKIGY